MNIIDLYVRALIVKSDSMVEIFFSNLVVFGACIMLDFLYDDIKLMSNAGNQPSVLL